MISSAFRLLLVLTVLTGILYPLTVTISNQMLFPEKSNGSLIVENGKIIGSELIGQNFTDPKFFWGRPSATVESPYNVAYSGGSNFGQSNPDFLNRVEDRILAYQKADPENKKPIPVDLVTASGSGLDPHISLAGALYQVSRIARARNVSEEKIRELILKNQEPKFWRIFGERPVNVLKLNQSLTIYH